jgi:hypothetical protein
MRATVFTPIENLEHKFAKETLYKWLVEGTYPFEYSYFPTRPTSGFQVWMEFPFIDSDGDVDVPDYHFYPEYQKYFKHVDNLRAETGFPLNNNNTGYFPIEAWPKSVKYVVDIAIMTKGYCHTVIEIKNKHPIGTDKFAFLSHRCQLVIEVPAHSILQQFKTPSMLKGVSYNGEVSTEWLPY